MSDTTATPPVNPLRQQLMRVGAVLTMNMANADPIVLPEELATATGVPLDLVLSIMNGSAPDAKLSDLAKLTTALSGHLILNVIVPAKPPVAPAVVVATPVPEATATPVPPPAA